MNATIGRIVIYTLTGDDSKAVNIRRVNERTMKFQRDRDKWPQGAQGHVGNTAKEGQQLPAMIVKVNDDETVNLKIFLDGSDTLWKENIEERNLGDDGYFAFPVVSNDESKTKKQK